MIPAGTYPAVVVPVQLENGTEVAIQFGKSKNGTQQAYVAFEILRGPQAGQKIGWLGFFSDLAVERTLKSLRYCGFSGDDLHVFPSQRPDNEVDIVIEHEKYNDKVSAKVQWVNAPGGGSFKMANAFGDKELRSFGAMLKGKLKAVAPVKGKKAEREAPSAAPAEDSDNGGGWSGNDDPDPPKDNPNTNDDIPF